MMHAIHSGYAEKLTLEEIAGAGHVCKSACEKLFHTYLHCTPVEYLQRFRLQKAAERLCKTETPVAQIALDCGFSGASYFTGCFKKSMAARRKRTAAAAKTRKRKNANRAVLFQSDSVCILFRITGLSA